MNGSLNRARILVLAMFNKLHRILESPRRQDTVKLTQFCWMDCRYDCREWENRLSEPTAPQRKSEEIVNFFHVASIKGEEDAKIPK